MCCATHRLRLSALLLVALVGFIAGLTCGRLGEVVYGDSPAGLKYPPVPHPRSLFP